MLVPKRAKFRKQFRGDMRGKAIRGSVVNFGKFGLKAQSPGWVSSRQIEAARRVMTHYTQKGGRVWIRIFPDKPISDKPPEVRMGGGKGDVVDYVVPIKPGRILFEMDGITYDIAKHAMEDAGRKLPVRTKFIEKL
ncbi:50S ribosomal protein L16 [Candidatus Gottesmanbacteria bacterium RIFCSPHIGHO2_01_FULL_39_10]|uniref:Large ribosomal subunit protein uL16 n=1 Tax=Candidatus Gottesmanbacteria bacterium RIFCSPHIGHO2_01_FULL_39_10 TaxID=1798375 RepID=A0A1F5ZSI9_9BACT|nr:MAG: 50S ribosomal protein L16 [Candidatus Gottesmanbacteria bacterium RIFCSPHIGHO2_01_FULL_39_10]